MKANTPTLPELLRVAKHLLKEKESFKCTIKDQEYVLKITKKRHTPKPVHIKTGKPELYK